MSNVCRHRQAIMLKGRGHTREHIVCPLHRWTYDLHGRLVGAPHFEQDPCLNLRNYPVQNWHGLLFEHNGRDVCHRPAALGVAAQLDFSGYVFDPPARVRLQLEDLHRGLPRGLPRRPLPPRPGPVRGLRRPRWEFGRHHSVQTVGVNAALAKPGSAGVPALARRGAALQPQRPAAQGAIWLTYYPTVMVEWYPQVLVVSTLFPKGPQKTLNLVEFFYPEEIAAFEPEFVEAQQAAYMETCVEDDEIALRMDAGRKALMERGDDEPAPTRARWKTACSTSTSGTGARWA
jgi:choline monooxygenase